MLKVFFRVCVVAVASFALTLAAVPVQAAGLASHPVGPPAVSWMDGAAAWVGALWSALPAPVRPALKSQAPTHRFAKAGHRGWLHPTCDTGVTINPGGSCL